ncbi:MAG TPA: hypothetical protein PK096_03015 [Candidatus Saccharibacteria bacterium]|nr:hypothetical protein [Candidatus Saccharibacteria bacterium]HRK94312.1 hypothetical protein [Candidatus Saccharibacteria bacterium]
MLFLHHKLAFAKADPMDDGLADDIAAEQAEAERFELKEQLDGRLADEWEEILKDARKDPDFTFVSDE